MFPKVVLVGSKKQCHREENQAPGSSDSRYSVFGTILNLAFFSVFNEKIRSRYGFQDILVSQTSGIMGPYYRY
jgi:hypothetical protein